MSTGATRRAWDKANTGHVNFYSVLNEGEYPLFGEGKIRLTPADWLYKQDRSSLFRVEQTNTLVVLLPNQVKRRHKTFNKNKS